QPLQGERLAKRTAALQPAKLAAMESLFRTTKAAPLVVGGIPSEETETVRYGIKIPKLLSFLAHGDFNAEVTGLDRFPRENWPPVTIIHVAFQTMVGIGTVLAAVGAWSLFALWKNPSWLRRGRTLRLFVVLAPLGFAAVEAGWTVTEVGRQPWIIYGIIK